MRGLRTLRIRVKQAAKITKKIIEYLETHPKVDRILYPHHKSICTIKLAKNRCLNKCLYFLQPLKRRI